jgi:hypothetical protein
VKAHADQLRPVRFLSARSRRKDAMETPTDEPRDDAQDAAEDLTDLEPAQDEETDVQGGQARIDKLPRN